MAREQNGSAQSTGTATSRARQVRRAVRKQTKARLALSGPSGSGKTWTALSIAQRLAPGGRIVVMDTEPGDGSQGAAELYADHFEFDTIQWEPPFDPRDLTITIRELGAEGYHVGIIDSASHFWRGPGGTLDISDGRFGGWKTATPVQDAMVEAILRSPMHMIVCTRAKQAYEVQVGADGKQDVVKLGLAPIQRDDLEYEFQVVAMMDVDHRIDVGKTRCHLVAGKSYHANEQGRFADVYADWLEGGVELVRQIEVDALRTAVATVTDEAARVEVKKGFKDEFGEPNQLPADQAPAAWAWLAGNLEVEAHPFRGPADPEAAPVCEHCGTLAVARWHAADAPEPPAKRGDGPERGSGEAADREAAEGPSEAVTTSPAPPTETKAATAAETPAQAPEGEGGATTPADPPAEEGADEGAESGAADEAEPSAEDEAARAEAVIGHVKGLEKRAVVDELNRRELATSGKDDTLRRRLAEALIADGWEPEQGTLVDA